MPSNDRASKLAPLQQSAGPVRYAEHMAEPEGGDFFETMSSHHLSTQL